MVGCRVPGTIADRGDPVGAAPTPGAEGRRPSADEGLQRDRGQLLVAVGSALALQIAAVYLPVLQRLLGTVPLAAADLALIGALSVLGYAAIRLDRIVHVRLS